MISRRHLLDSVDDRKDCLGRWMPPPVRLYSQVQRYREIHGYHAIWFEIEQTTLVRGSSLLQTLPEYFWTKINFGLYLVEAVDNSEDCLGRLDASPSEAVQPSVEVQVACWVHQGPCGPFQGCIVPLTLFKDMWVRSW